MKHWKLGVLIVFGAITGLGVSYAYSTEQQKVEWRGNPLLGGCRLTAEKTTEDSWNFIAGNSRTTFISRWPTSPGELILNSEPTPAPSEILPGAEPPLPNETLKIKFEWTEGKLEPISFVYENVKGSHRSNKLIQPASCSLQWKKR